ncbi:MAG: 3-deoxy-manno-octulosonate cytidylyltransferase [Desulfovibrio sp.]|nr:3-deoxy-manno-octulosonate cytidylyltransferase [Desulfovibrio sp.]
MPTALPEAHGIIPARYASTRFPGKPLADLKGFPMFYHVWRRASRCPDLSSVTLATDDERIREAAGALGVPVLMTSSRHESGTDRVCEAALALRLPDDAVIVNIQGDEPALDPEVISKLVRAFADPEVRAATLACPLDPADLPRPDKVKVVTDAKGDALYFSRAGIPYRRNGECPVPLLGHMGIYAFTMHTLQSFVALLPSPLERTEKLEQLRLLENGIKLRVLVADKASPCVDRKEDTAAVLPLLDDYRSEHFNAGSL